MTSGDTRAARAARGGASALLTVAMMVIGSLVLWVGALELVLVVTAGLAVVAFGVWFFIFTGPGPSLAPSN